MGHRHLQQREGVFHPVIRRQRRVESRRGLQFVLADRGQNLRLHRNSGWSIPSNRAETDPACLILLKAPAQAMGGTRPGRARRYACCDKSRRNSRGMPGSTGQAAGANRVKRNAKSNRMFMFVCQRSPSLILPPGKVRFGIDSYRLGLPKLRGLRESFWIKGLPWMPMHLPGPPARPGHRKPGVFLRYRPPGWSG